MHDKMMETFQQLTLPNVQLNNNMHKHSLKFDQTYLNNFEIPYPVSAICCWSPMGNLLTIKN